MDFVHDAPRYVKVAERMSATVFCTVAAVTILVWDIIIQMDEEVEYIWKRDWKMAGKPLYLIGDGANTCEVYYLVMPICTLALLVLVDTILGYRVLCLYKMDHRLLIINVTVFLTGIAATLAIVGYSFPRFDVVPTPKYVSGCWFTSGSFVFMAFIPPLVFELWLFVLVVFKLYRYIRESGGLSQRTFGRIILEDSANWFVMIAVLILWNALHLAFSPEGARGIALPYLRTFIIMGGCRLIIHMRREMFRHQYNQGSDSQISTTIEFRNVEVARAEDEDHRWNKARAITFAQQIGLPPASNNMALMWAESPEGSFDTESDDDGDIPLRHVTFGGHDNRESVVAP